MKRTIAILLAAVMLLGMIPLASADAGMENFQKSQTYNAGQFADVKASDWFAPGVQSAFELGLMKGSSDTAFKPTGNLTVAEALAIACRLHSIYADNKQEFTQGSPWYQVYVDYAVANKIMTAGQLNPTAQITREQFAYLMCGAIPEADLNAINTITAIPDTKADSTYGGFVYRLYNAGVLTGSDKYGTFKPTTAIQRSEVATIVTRMADKNQRIKFTPEKVLTDIRLQGKTQISVGESTTWTAEPLPEGAKAPFSWTSSNMVVATVNQDGTIVGHEAGESVISITADNGVKKSVKITIAEPLTPQLLKKGIKASFAALLTLENSCNIEIRISNNTGRRIRILNDYYNRDEALYPDNLLKVSASGFITSADLKEIVLENGESTSYSAKYAGSPLFGGALPSLINMGDLPVTVAIGIEDSVFLFSFRRNGAIKEVTQKR